MTTRTLPFLLLLTLTLLLAACQGTQQPAQKTSEPPPAEPIRTPGGEGVQQPGEPNPTGTPVGERPIDQPIDTPMATTEVPEGTPMATEQEQAMAFLNFMERQPDAPRWVLTWQMGQGRIDFDAVTGILQVRTPDGVESRVAGMNHDAIKDVAAGKRGWLQ